MKLKQNKIYKYGYDNGKYGAEAKYLLDGTTLKIHLLGSNHWRDWIDNFTFWKMKEIEYYNGEKIKVQRAWYYYAFRLYKFIEKEIFPDNEICLIRIHGHSMGGAVGTILKYLYSNNPYILISCCTYGSPLAFSRKLLKYFCTSIINRGDIVPYLTFWRPRPKPIIKQGKFTFNFIKAHMSYKIDITKN